MALGREDGLEGSGEVQETIWKAIGRPDGRWRDLPEIYLLKKTYHLLASASDLETDVRDGRLFGAGNFFLRVCR